MDEKNKELRVADLLGTGKENAMTTAELLELTGFQTARALQNQIAKERKEVVICSGSGRGYWLPANREEIEEFNNNMTSRAVKIFESSKCARDALGIATGQVDIFGEIYGGGDGE
ncbi:MAG: hypothetical protein MJ097_02245 [Dorea sp.]|nr:hypothetical protein [Dorea sp.]